MMRLIAIVAFALAVIFYAGGFGRGTFDWTLLMLIGLLCFAADDGSWWPWHRR